MASTPASKTVLLALAFAATVALAAESKKEFKYTVGPKPLVTIVNEYGPVTVKGVPGHQVTITATTHSDKVDVDSSQAGNRTEARTHMQDGASPDEARVDYEVSVPMDASVSVRGSTGPYSAERLRGDVILEGDLAKVEVRDVSDAHVHVHTVDGPISLTNVSGGHVEITSVGGDVELLNVTGPKVTVNTTNGNIRYTGDFGSNGDYSLTNNFGNIDVSLPASASVDLTARSMKGSAFSDFPLEQSKRRTTFPLTAGKAFAGTANSGASSVRLRSLSGTIRVTKR
ncbi:MAG TPA: DUF4097 family beta strand repeat-containing protein [Terriglobales bacterium]|nr:DUF4097 family beta strand repeat-containing protein [Terriglobales bacterium]